IVAVLEQRVGPLEKEAAKAKTYHELFARKKELDITLAIYDIDHIATQTEEFERSFVMAKHALEMANDTLASLESQTMTLYEKQDENKQKLQDATDSLTVKNKEKSTVATEHLLAEKELEHGKNELSRYETELTKEEALLAQANTALEQLKETLTLAKEKQKRLTKRTLRHMPS
ncbi:MAG: hypothetical protein IJW46_05120, partial [Clostridia bacterium]|nr:hypothetical protein [Clostridia bacterium]